MSDSPPSAARPGRARRGSAPRRRRLRRRVLLFGAAGLALATLVAIVAAGRITAGFEAREREERSVLLGRPHLIAPASLGGASDLERRLERLGYRRTSRPSAPGEYAREGESVTAHLRGFAAPDVAQPAGAVRARFRHGRVATVDPAAPARLEPEPLAVFQGPNLEEREIVDPQQCPQHLTDAVLAVEDRRFFRHPGIDLAGIARAARANVAAGGISQGGSTLTQQLAKNLYFSGDRTFGRKAAEVFAAFVLEANYDKPRILRAYLNEIYLGQRGAASVRGVGAAARHYFNKPASRLTLDESALLAGLIRAPGTYNPFQHPDRARQRRDAVLAAMEELGTITSAERAAATSRPVQVRRSAGTPRSRRAPYVTAVVGAELESAYGEEFWSRGLRVHTTLEPGWQDAAETAVRDGLERLERDYRSLRHRRGSEPLQAALVSIDLRDGSIVALVGGRDFATSQFNRVLSAHRQPGSLFKPLVYAAGLGRDAGRGKPAPRRNSIWGRGDVVRDLAPSTGPERATGDTDAAAIGAAWPALSRRPAPIQDAVRDDENDEIPALPLTAATMLLDEPYEVRAGGKVWSPRNDDDEFRGPVTVQQALEQSLNVPTARAAAAIGLGRVAATAAALGIRSPLPEVPALALGAAEVTPIEIATAFATLASGGVRREPFLVRAVVDAEGRTIAHGGDVAGGLSGHAGAAGEQAIPRETADVMTALLQGVLDHGTGRSARTLGFTGVAAAKTGTSDDGRDLWFCGFTPRVLTLVWVGYDDGRPTPLSGSRAALPIWVDYMSRIGAGSDEPFDAAERVVWADIDPTTGGLARPRCPESRRAPFIPGTEPAESCREHGSFWERLFGR